MGTPASSLTHDIAIIGGGLVGASLGCALEPLIKRHGLRVVIIEPSALPSLDEIEGFQPSFDARASAIAEGSAQRFQQLGLWSSLVEQATSIHRIHVSERGQWGATRLSAADMKVKALGHVIPNAWMGQVLHRRLSSIALSWQCPAGVSQVTEIPEGHRLTLDSGEEVRASLSVLADGGRSGLKKQLGIKSQRHDYGQTALIAHVEVSRPHQGVAYERFTPHGPLALLPLPGKVMELVWTHREEDIPAIAGLSDADFLTRLQDDFGDRAGRFVRVGQRHLYPLALTTADQAVRPGLAILGNSAHSLHPVAGQGFNLALRGVMDLAEALEQPLAKGQAAGDMAVLQAFERARAKDRDRVIRFSDGLVRLFGLDWPLAGHLRGAGLTGLNLIGPLRRGLARQAMGVER